ncbi:hypothetical protein [Pedobacter gandavensis]|uniref:hypothetical protein n=1 Tax=Pedobacter gandavensis TaxID=2679963 RepID=UPI00292D38FF|nr:hypothetical protein [Pedobacter gandavensis]
MIYLKIENNKGYFLRKKSDETIEFTEIDQITKDDLFYLLNQVLNDDYEMDEFNESILSNKAHQIIYKNLHEKFIELLSNKTRFKDESENLYKTALDKYTVQDN